MKLRFLAAYAMCAAVACAQAAAAEAPPAARKAAAAKSAAQAAPVRLVTHHFFVSGSGGGIAQMQMPAAWQATGRSSPIALRLQSPDAPDRMMLTAFPVAQDKLAMASDDKLREMLNENGRSLLKFSAETGFDLLPLPGAHGYFFSLSDKKLAGKPGGPDKFPFVHSGVLRFGDWVGVFNIYSNEREGHFVQQALAAVASLDWSPPVNPELGARAVAAMRLPAPPGVTPKTQPACVSPSALQLYTRFNDLYAPMLGTHVVKSAFETYDAGGDSGSVLYLSFNLPLQNDVKAFVAGLLWGEAFPTRAHPEEFFTTGNEMVIWCTQLDSGVKRLSQARLEASLFATPGASKKRR